jgi:hypothetical protein
MLATEYSLKQRIFVETNCGPGLKLSSSDPSAFNRAILARGTPFTDVNSPVTINLPSGCRAMRLTNPLKPASGNVASSDPSAFTRANRARDPPL